MFAPKKHGIGIILVMILSVFSGQLFGYTKLENDRVLLMNNDTHPGAEITSQGYYDTDTSAKTYWVHTGDPVQNTIAFRNLLNYSNHKMYSNDGKLLWELEDCRAGSATTISATRNYIPWTPTAIPLNNSATMAVGQVGSAILRNSESARIYSPYYKDGIGTIYFDIVNAYTVDTQTKIAVEIATDTIGSKEFETAENNDYNFNWKEIPFDVLEVVNSNTVNVASTQVTNLTLASTASRCGLFYRVRASLNYYKPIRFRIRRLNKYAESTQKDATGLVLVDNIIASYPPMSARVKRFGADLDYTLTGGDVMGCYGDFSKPFASPNLQDAKPIATYEGVTNAAIENPEISVSNMEFHYRWRYLNQASNEWKKISFETQDGTNFIGTTSIDFSAGAGDIEYFYTTEVTAPAYEVQDYAFVDPRGFGDGWKESPSSVTNRASFDAAASPSSGTDYFARVRNGESPFGIVKVVGEGPVYDNVGKTNIIAKISERMELVGDHLWRFHYHIPTNFVGETFRFHFEGDEYVLKKNGFGFNMRGVEWYPKDNVIKELPYTSVAVEGGTKRNLSITFENLSTHILIEFNDRNGSFSVSRATHQNFNAWSDAINGFVGNTVSTAAVSDVKQRYTANMAKWELAVDSNRWWNEPFDLNGTTFGAEFYTPYATHSTPNGWTADNGMFVLQDRLPKTSSIAFQLEGRGRGALSLDKLDANNMPEGIRSVKFSARVAQSQTFDDFAWHVDAASETNYAFGAKLTMSRTYERTNGTNPSDMSPANPSVSLVSYYRPQKGCYEFRITRTGEKKLTASLYKWTFSGSTQNTKLLDSKTLECDGKSRSLLVPMAESEINKMWTSAYIKTRTTPSGTEIECMLSTNQNASTSLATDANSKFYDKVCTFTDSDQDRLTKGAYGVGSVDCNAGFGIPTVIGLLNDGSVNFNDTTSIRKDTIDSDWAFSSARYRTITSSGFVTDNGIAAVMPSGQNISLQFSTPGTENNSWIDSGLEPIQINSFATNTFEFFVHTANKYNIRLKAGGTAYDTTRSDIVVDDVYLTSWRAPDVPMLNSDYGLHREWIYTEGWLETIMTISGGEYEVFEAGTNEYVFVFKQPNSQVTIKPKEDIEIARALIVGGGGAGGASLGGGGGGGGVVDQVFAPGTVMKAGSSVTLSVGAGGVAKKPTGSGQGANAMPVGGTGGTSQLTINSKTYRAYGGAGGNSFGQTVATGTYGSGGGGSNNRNTTGNFNNGNKGGISASGSSGAGGGGAGGAGKNTEGCLNVKDSPGKAGDGGPGLASDITGEIRYYGAGGGGGVGWTSTHTNGVGGISGDGTGSWGKSAAYHALVGTPDGPQKGQDGYGGGGGGGTHVNTNSEGTPKGQAADGGCGVVILRVKRSTRCLLMQPSRGVAGYPMSLRSPYLAEGISTFSFSYANAHSNCVVKLQICTNMYDRSSTYRETLSLDEADWTTLTNFSFKGMTDQQRAGGTLSYFMSYRAPTHGLVRLLMDESVKEEALKSSDPNYGSITITMIYCFDEPALDNRSWWGWNMHTGGWLPDGSSTEYSYLFDSPNGMSGMLNFSSDVAENNSADAKGIGLSDSSHAEKYKENNPFVQSPAIATGIGSVTFRARKFDPTSSNDGVLVLYGTTQPTAYQPGDPDMWEKLDEFVISNATYSAYEWKYSNDKSPYVAVRLSVPGARNTRTSLGEDWEKTDYKNWNPRQRVCVDEISVSEPIVPSVALRDVCTFRQGLTDLEVTVITNITSFDQQPIVGESWGIYARVEPQQMDNQMNLDSVRVFASVYLPDSATVVPWGYNQWSNKTQVISTFELPRAGTNLVFRSCASHPETIMQPIENGGTIVQYTVWATYEDNEGVSHIHPLDSSDWQAPSWYWPKDFNALYGSNDAAKFSAYSIFDTVSPKRAWINEINFNDGRDAANQWYSVSNQFIELSFPSGADMKGWYVNVSGPRAIKDVLARIGQDDCLTTFKTANAVNHFVFYAIQSPLASRSKVFGSLADGTWNASLDSSVGMYGDEFNSGATYGIELVRPTGVVEHQIVLEGTNIYAGTMFEVLGNGTNTLEKLVEADGSGSSWFLAGADKGTGSLGVISNQGAAESDWKNSLFAKNTTSPMSIQGTPGKLNQIDANTFQDIPENWWLAPNGTNMWVYASILGDNMWQILGTRTNTSTVLVLPKGTSTNILYKAAPWHEMGSCTVNGRAVSPVPAGNNLYRLEINDISTNLDIYASAKIADSLVQDYGLDESNKFTPAIIDWLLKDHSAENAEIKPAIYVKLSEYKNPENGVIQGEEMSLTDMYFLDINPIEGGWKVIAGMGGHRNDDGIPDIEYIVRKNRENLVVSNVRFQVTMMITNDDGRVHAPYMLRGVEPGSTTYSYVPGTSQQWTSTTFKITGALQRKDIEGIKDKYLPLRWFVFGPDSFGKKGDLNEYTACIEILEPHGTDSEGFNYNWHDHPDVPVYFKWRLDGEPAHNEAPALLTTNSVYNAQK